MVTITVTSIIDKAAITLQDPTNIRWPRTELVGWLNDGQREVALYKPSAFVKNTSVTLVAGTKQTLPTDGVSLVDVVRNLGSDGATPGNAVRIVSREILDAQVPDWHTSAKANGVVKHFVYTPLDPKTYYVYPPQPATPTRVEVIYVAAPTDAAEGGAITLDDIYVTALLNYVLYRAYSKDAEYAANAQAAAAYYQQFIALITGKAAAEGNSNPNQVMATVPFNPNLPGGAK